MEGDFDNEDPNEEVSVEEIAPYVIGSLRREGFFEKLESMVFPTGVIDNKVCDGTYAISIRILTESGFDEEDQLDLLAVAQSMGGFCDCEIVLNVDEDSKVRADYWRGEQSTPEP